MTGSKIAVGCAWILLALYVSMESLKLGLGSLQNPASGFMPFLSAMMIVLLSIPILAQEWKNRRRGAPWGAVRWDKIGIILLGIIAYALLLQRLGILPTSFLVLVLFFRILGTPKWRAILLYSLLVTLCIHLIFNVWLQCQFPQGILRF